MSTHQPSPSFRLTSSLALALFVSLQACGGGSADGAGTPDVSPSRSSVETRFGGPLVSDGVSAVVIAVGVRDEAGRALAGRSVHATASGDGNDFWPAANLVTDGDGRAEFRLTSTTPGGKQVRITVDQRGGARELDDLRAVDFAPPVVPRKRVSVRSNGDEATDFSRQADIAGNGRFVAFQSKADNLVANDSNQKEDVFVHDLESGVTERVSLTPSGAQFTDLCGEPSIADGGLDVAFQGRDGDVDAIYVRDRLANLTRLVSDAAGPSAACTEPSISGDGRYVAFARDDGESRQVWVVDTATRRAELVSKDSNGVLGNGESRAPCLSRDGRWVAFASTADNLIADDSNEKDDVFVHDRLSGTTRRISELPTTTGGRGHGGNDDSSEPVIAADGRWVAFTSKASNLVPGDDNGKADVFLADLVDGSILRVSVDERGRELDKESGEPDVSADGAYVVFVSLADGLVTADQNGKWDVFCRDVRAGRTVRVSLGRGGDDPDSDCGAPSLACDAPVVAFGSIAKNLVRDDSNDQEDVFVAPR